MTLSKEQTIGEVVAQDFRTAPVFEKYGLDFCCGGNQSIESACDASGVDVESLLTALKQIERENKSNIDYNAWPIDLLADYIEKTHHRYVSQQIPLLKAYLEKISNVHGDRHPELLEIKELFDGCAEELTSHMQKEEKVLFPFVRKMVSAKQSAEAELAIPFGTVQNPISMMMHEHDAEGERFRKIAQLSNQYALPADGCSTYKVAMDALKAFENDLHIHIHLENNILFPKAIALEEDLV
ncbi:iron-sulfur cluster repair di-iron protein [Pseudopedobacter saltans DSM 12145]|uniref:Iron-sulfur cluster repair di-iron protein n=2 Tax=Pseudopedobacter saltans TaxID=151895 RepID=F0S4Z1_PSESL|nr:iron-sulfur cluster repair di-iron protein [Pseudopedobacter saltans DSM 12145]